MTHEELRKRAVKWLVNSRRCSVVLSEMVSAAWECPDAIGWRQSYSTLIECKASRADFHRNGDKPTIRADRGMGRERYFLVPEGLISVADMERYEGYGLLWADKHSVRVKKPATSRETNKDGEILMLVSALRRVRTREFLTIVTEAPSEGIQTDPERDPQG